MAVEAQLDPAVPRRERTRRLRKLADWIQYLQDRRRKAARIHRKLRLRKLHQLGIRISQLRRCDRVF